LAEADGNRTRQAEVLDFTGFEDREGHQAPVRLHAPVFHVHSHRITGYVITGYVITGYVITGYVITGYVAVSTYPHGRG
jgi:hypothetical protein